MIIRDAGQKYPAPLPTETNLGRGAGSCAGPFTASGKSVPPNQIQVLLCGCGNAVVSYSIY